jgi:tight adherence protein B
VIGPALLGGLAAVSWGLLALAVRVRAADGITTRAGAVVGATAMPVRERVGRWLGRLGGSRGAWIGAAAAGGWLVLGPVVGIAAAPLAGAAFEVRRRRHDRRRAIAMDEGMADGVRAIAAGLRAGLSVPQAIRFAADEAEAPLAGSLARIVDAADVGEPLDTAIHRWARDAGTADARLVEGVLGLHRRSGGDLPRVLDRVAETLRERRAVSREVRALTAQARLSGAILGLLPIGFFAFLWLTSRRDIEGAFRTPLGLACLGLGLLLELLAFLWIRRLLEVR